MYFLGSDNPSDILRILQNYPFFQELYQDIMHFRFQPKELISMYSEALRIMDENTVKFMIDELKSTISQQDVALAEKDSTISEMGATISEMAATISEMAAETKKLLAELAKYKNQE